MQNPTKSMRETIFRPTTSLSGSEAPAVLRGQNYIARGLSAGNPYFEAFPGNKDLNENYDLASETLTGTLACTSGNSTVVGTGTLFKTELGLGQHILAGTQVLDVQAILDDTHFLCSSDRPPDTSESGLTGYCLLQLSEIDGKRFVSRTGNGIRVSKGHIVAVGRGQCYINGQILPGSTLILSSRPKAAIYRPATNDYVIRNLGYLNAPPQPTVEMITGGTKGMVDLQKHSFMLSYWSGQPEGTGGYSDPCDPVKLDIHGAAIQVNGTLNKFRIDLTTSLVSAPSNCKGFIIWKSQEGKASKSISGATVTVVSPNDGLYNNGPWLKAAQVLTSDLLSGNKYEFDCLDTDLGAEVTGGNDIPPGSEFVTEIEQRPAYFSCFGQGTVSAINGSNPGPFIAISKFDNPDAAPEEWLAKVSGTILGMFPGVGRWFTMSSNSIDFAVSTGLYGQQSDGGQDVALPIVSRPYWKTGATNRYSVIQIDETLFGRSGGKFFQSIGDGDINVQKYDFGKVVEDIVQTWSDGFVLAANDPLNTQAIFVHTAAYKNEQGYWVTEMLPYSLVNAWLPKIVLSSPTRDMIVSGVATVNQKLEFLCGGRVQGGTFQMKTYRFAAGGDVTNFAPPFILWQPTDDNEKDISKQIHSIRPTGKFTNLNVQIHGAKPGGVLSVSDMEAGINYISQQTFSNSADVTRYLRKKMKAKNLGIYAIRLASTWNGTGKKDRLDDCVIEINAHGRRR